MTGPIGRRAFGAWAAAVAGAGLLPSASGQGWPQQPIRIVVPWPPGGVTDVIARTVGPGLSAALVQPVVIDNEPGAGGNIGTGQAVREKPDGHTLILVTSTTQAINPHLYEKLPFDPVRDFTPVAYLAAVPNVLVVPARSPYRSVQDVVAAARKSPSKLTFASGGNGSSQHVAAAIFESAAQIDLTHVPYKGSAPAVTDLIAGQVDLMLDTGSIAHVKAGTLRALAVAADAPIAALPNVPTMSEAGLRGVVAAAWYGVMGPAGLSPNVVARLNQVLNAQLKDPATVTRLHEMGAQIGGGSPDDFRRFVSDEYRRYAQVVRSRGIKVE